jgi:hypothetical protein
MRGFSRLILLVILCLLTAGTLGGVFIWPSLLRMVTR